jgi:CRISPR-associated endonuclease Csn1
MKQYYKLALDLGTSSIGWTIFDLIKDPAKSTNEKIKYIPHKIRKMGVRIFPDSRIPNKCDKPTLASRRRAKRLHRRGIARTKMRKNTLMNALVSYGFMPEDITERKKLELLDPFKLRVKGLDRALENYEFGRAIFHLSQRRGFKSNRKSGESDGKIATGIKKLHEKLAENSHRTYGEYLYSLLIKSQEYQLTKQKNPATNLEKPDLLSIKLSSNNAKEYSFYPDREIIHQEFLTLWDIQKNLNPEPYTNEAFNKIEQAIFYQRPLKEQLAGYCSKEKDKKQRRCSIMLPVFEKYRLLQTLANLEYYHVDNRKEKFRLSLEYRDRIYSAAEKAQTAKLTFTQIREILNVGEDYKFNYEYGKKTGIPAFIAGAKFETELKNTWLDLNFKQKNNLVKVLLGEDLIDELDEYQNATLTNQKESDCEFQVDTEENISDSKQNKKRKIEFIKLKDDREVKNILIERFNFSETDAYTALDEAFPNLLKNLKAGYSSLSELALNKLIKVMEDESLQYNSLLTSDKAMEIVYGKKDLNIALENDKLPYYGEVLESSCVLAPEQALLAKDTKSDYWIANPTVHVALNQLRTVVNSILDKYDIPPKQISIELSRDLRNNKKQKERIKDSQAANEKLKKEFEETAVRIPGVNVNSADDYQRFKLWKEMDVDGGRQCVYTGKTISLEKVFSREIQVEHIKPFSKSLDDSFKNKVLVYESINHCKKNKTPFQAFESNNEAYNDGYDWDEIKERAYQMFYTKNRGKYFNLVSEEEVKVDGFLARHLNDTRYLSRAAKNYLECICSDITVLPGTLTGKVRNTLELNKLLRNDDLNEKNRSDHRHHALDAFIIGLVDRGFINKISRLCGKYEIQSFEGVIERYFHYNSQLIEELPKHLDKVIVSFKPDHAYQGEMHEETELGLSKEPDLKTGLYYPFRRKNLSELKNEKDFIKIKDLHLRKTLENYVLNHHGEFKEAISDFVAKPPKGCFNIKKVMMQHEQKPKKMVLMHNEAGKPYKGYQGGNNWKCIVFEDAKGKLRFKVVTTYEAYQIAKGFLDENSLLPPHSIRKFDLFANDLVQFEDDEGKPHVFRVVKMTSARNLGDNKVAFIKHNLAVAGNSKDVYIDGSMEKGSGPLQKYNLKKLQLSPIGT